jgi:hypothetical protein
MVYRKLYFPITVRFVADALGRAIALQTAILRLTLDLVLIVDMPAYKHISHG